MMQHKDPGTEAARDWMKALENLIGRGDEIRASATSVTFRDNPDSTGIKDAKEFNIRLDDGTGIGIRITGTASIGGIAHKATLQYRTENQWLPCAIYTHQEAENVLTFARAFTFK